MKYEYKTVEIENKTRFARPEIKTSQIEDILNTNAQIGWELVTITPITGSYGYTHSLLLSFKRQIEA